MDTKVIEINAGTLYDANKQLVKQTCKVPLIKEELASKQIEIETWFHKISTYAMLLCHDIRYFTIFHLSDIVGSEAKAAQECIGCLEDQNGDILSIEHDEKNDSWEIWIKVDDTPIVFYLFDYTKGVIEC